MKKFKRFDGSVDDFVPIAVCRVDLDLQLGFPVSKFLCLHGVGVGLDHFEQPQVEQTPLMLPHGGEFLLKFFGTSNRVILIPARQNNLSNFSVSATRR